MKYRINRRKLGKAPTSVITTLFACLEFDDSAPHFEKIRQYMLPQTQEERWAELEEAVKAAFASMKARQESAFNEQFRKIRVKLWRLSELADRLTTKD